MKKILILSAVFVAFSFSEKPLFSSKNIEKNFSRITAGVYLNKFEVSNGDYLNFLGDIAKSADQKTYSSLLPDTLVWRNASAYNEPFTSFYFRHLSYTNYPVLGVSYESAGAYCNWLTDAYNSDPKRKFQKVIFRLPTSEEWTLGANGGDAKKQYPWGTGFIKNNRSMDLCNYRQDVELKLNEKTKMYEAVPDASGHTRIKITTPVKAFYPTSGGLYNMSGNAAEMVLEKGIAKGGSYNDPAWAVTIASEKKYDKPAADIGFRVLMEVLEK